MQVHNVVNSQIIERKQNFKGGSVENGENSSDKDKKKSIEKDKNPNFFVKLITHPSLLVIPLLPVAIYNIINPIQENSLKKTSASLEQINKFNKNSLKITLALFAASMPLYFTTNYINQKFKDKNFAKAQRQVDNFNKENEVNVKLTRSPIDKKNFMVLGGFSPLTAQMLLPEKIFDDVFNANFRQKYIIKHELKHAQQYILMASSENGINKLNYLCAKKASERLSDKQKLNIREGYNEWKNNQNNKNKTFKINGYELNSENYLTALYKIIYEEETNPDNIPIIINKEFYEKAKSAKGPLTEKEENKAELYLEAYEKYPARIGFAETINPFSSYRRNLLEKEAYGF